MLYNVMVHEHMIKGKWNKIIITYALHIVQWHSKPSQACIWDLNFVNSVMLFMSSVRLFHPWAPSYFYECFPKFSVLTVGTLSLFRPMPHKLYLVTFNLKRSLRSCLLGLFMFLCTSIASFRRWDSHNDGISASSTSFS